VGVFFVGATTGGRISLSFADVKTNAGRPATSVTVMPPVLLGRGAELGAFNLGSTIVVFAADPALQPAGVDVGAVIRMGQALWRCQ
jgi:phosphatidylserine decarboxylase